MGPYLLQSVRLTVVASQIVLRRQLFPSKQQRVCDLPKRVKVDQPHLALGQTQQRNPAKCTIKANTTCILLFKRHLPLRRQRQLDLSVVKASLVYRVSSKRARAVTQRNSAPKTKQSKRHFPIFSLTDHQCCIYSVCRTEIEGM